MSFIMGAAVVAAGILLGRLVGRTFRRRREEISVRLEAAGTVAGPPGDPFAGLPCRVGDVIVRRSGVGEAWLAGALVLSEQWPVAALFVAPEAGSDRAVYADGGAALTWLAPLAKGALGVGGEPPHAIEHDSTRFERRRRLPVRVHRVGEHVPPFEGDAIVGEYAGPGAARIVVLAGKDVTLAWKGVVLAKGEYEVLPGTSLRRSAS